MSLSDTGNQKADAKNWVVQSLTVNAEKIDVIDSQTNTKMKVEVNSSQRFMRIYFPGAIAFSDKDYEESKGSRLATDMNMQKTPDNVLYNICLSDDYILSGLKKREDKVLYIPLDEDTELLIELASKWSMNDLFQTIQNCKL